MQKEDTESTDDAAWPPPPEGQRQPATHYAFGGHFGAAVNIDNDILVVRFLGLRTMMLSLGCIFPLASMLGPVFTVMHPTPSRLAAVLPLASNSTGPLFMLLPAIVLILVILPAILWLEYDLLFHRGTYRLTRNRTVVALGLRPVRLERIQYVKIRIGKGLNRFSAFVLLAVDEPNQAIRRWLPIRAGWLSPKEVMLTSLCRTSAAERAAQMIGEFLDVPVIVEKL